MIGASSPVVQDYLKAIWQAREWGGAPATTSSLAAHFGTSKANVCATLQRLTEQGLVSRQKYRPVELTERGSELAVAMVRRHRLIETFLVEQLGYDCTEVHEEAERLEHCASEMLIDRLDDLMGHPTSDPHGDPIPDAAGVVAYPEADPLTIVPAGRYVVVRVSDANEAALAKLHDIGIHPGSQLLLGVPGENREVETTGLHSRVLQLATQKAVWVRTAEAT